MGDGEGWNDAGNREIKYHTLQVNTEETVVKSFGKKKIDWFPKEHPRFCNSGFSFFYFFFKYNFHSVRQTLINTRHGDHGDYTGAFLNEVVK